MPRQHTKAANFPGIKCAQVQLDLIRSVLPVVGMGLSEFIRFAAVKEAERVRALEASPPAPARHYPLGSIP